MRCNFFQAITLIATLLCANSFAFAANLSNGDFSAGFSGWQGETTDLADNTNFINPLPGDYSGNYEASSGAAILTTTSNASPPNDIWSIALFQEFTVQALTPQANPLELSLDLSWDLSNASDFFQATLEDKSGNLGLLDLTSAKVFDITAWAGHTVEILFLVEDADDISDTLTIDNILISTSPIPIPPAVLLLTTGLAFLGFRKKTTS